METRYSRMREQDTRLPRRRSAEAQALGSEPHLDAHYGRVAEESRHFHIAATLELAHDRLSRSHLLGHILLRELLRASCLGQLLAETTALERRFDERRELGVLLGSLGDELVEEVALGFLG